MRNIFYFLAVFLFLSCNSSKEEKRTTMPHGGDSAFEKPDTNYDWLLGNWIQLTDDTEHETFEHWIKKSATHYLGHGFVMKEADTLWQEKMNLSFRDSLWILGIKTPGNNDLVEFSLTEIKPGTFSAENLNHDFPKRIKYWGKEDKINAVVSGENKVIHFEYARID